MTADQYYKDGLAFYPIDKGARSEIPDCLTRQIYWNISGQEAAERALAEKRGWKYQVWSEEDYDWVKVGWFIYMGPEKITEEEAKKLATGGEYNATST